MIARAKTLSKDKLALIHVARQQVSMAEEDYRAMLLAVAGVESAKDLSSVGFRAVMNRFGQLGFVSTHPQAGFVRRTGMATPEQVTRVRDMWRQWHGQDDDAALNRWLEKKYGVSALRFADVVKAQKAIEGLKAMLSRQQLGGVVTGMKGARV